MKSWIWVPRPKHERRDRRDAGSHRHERPGSSDPVGIGVPLNLINAKPGPALPAPRARSSGRPSAPRPGGTFDMGRHDLRQFCAFVLACGASAAQSPEADQGRRPVARSAQSIAPGFLRPGQSLLGLAVVAVGEHVAAIRLDRGPWRSGRLGYARPRIRFPSSR